MIAALIYSSLGRLVGRGGGGRKDVLGGEIINEYVTFIVIYCNAIRRNRTSGRKSRDKNSREVPESLHYRFYMVSASLIFFSK